MNRDPQYPKTQKTIVTQISFAWPRVGGTYGVIFSGNLGDIPVGWVTIPFGSVTVVADLVGRAIYVPSVDEWGIVSTAASGGLGIDMRTTVGQVISIDDTVDIYDSTTIWEVSHGDMRGVLSDRMDQCIACNSDWPMGDITYWRGRAYCPDCRSDIPRLIRQERGTRVERDRRIESETDFSSIVE